ncbi:type IV secretory system conjugative DNA transfer family protein [Kitasatospora sp. NPDC094016]|uniref:type IV secretory system conjugative DNA transfer family protein n=1 Tax=Kitasatospora sp. NPDC094016 TaxID=3154986 RepID=UPI00332952EF
MSTHLIVGPTGSGKTRHLRQLIAEAATDPATTTWAIDPRGELTTADRRATLDDAEQMLALALAVVDQRTTAPHNTRQHAHQPTADEPRIRLLIDEAEHLLRRETTAEQLYTLVTTGRPAAIETVIAVNDLRLSTWPLDLRDHYLAGTVTQLQDIRIVPAHQVLADATQD